MAYSPAGQITGFNYGNGVSAAFTYSSDRLQLQSLSYVKGTQTLSSLNYWYKTDATNCPSAPAGNNGQIQCIQDNVDNGRSATYTYDALYRLSTAVTTGSSAYPKWGLQESYDRYGNRSSQSIYSGCVAPMTCPTNSVTPDPTTNRISGNCYDANGNLLAESAPPCPSPTYTYDAENHLVNYMSTNPTYTYDGNGLRVKKVAGSTTTMYIFSGAKVIAEYDNGAAVGSPSREYIYAGGALLAKFESSATIYYHPDHLSNRVLSDASGNILGQRGNFPFGEIWYESGTATKLKFTTYERDAESGNDFAMARYYINRLARFSALDPMSGSASAPQSLNRYSYVQNDPVNATDPTGMLMVFLPSESGGGGDDSDLNPNCPGDESWDIGWYAPCPNYPQNPTVRPDPSGGGGGSLTADFRKKLKSALGNLAQRCKDILPVEKLAQLEDKLNFFDVRSSASPDAQTKGTDILPKGTPKTLWQATRPGDVAWVMRTTTGDWSNNVVIGPAWNVIDSLRQDAALVHEATHVATSQDDAQLWRFAQSKGAVGDPNLDPSTNLTNWIAGGCKEGSSQ